MTSRDQPQQHGVGGAGGTSRISDDSLRELLRLRGESMLEVERLQAQVAQLTEEREKRDQEWLYVISEPAAEAARLRARCASLEAVADAAKGIALRQSPAHQALRQALAAIDQHATTTQEGTH